VTNRPIDGHLGAETLQAFLEGELSVGERARTEEHLASCARCAGELDGWRFLFDELGTLPTLAPERSFHDRVMAGVRPAEALPWAARVAAFMGLGARDRHPASEGLQDFADGVLSGRRAARVRSHVDDCPACAGDVALWRSLNAGLSDLPHLAPAEGFAQRVMAQVRVPAPVPAPVPEWRRALAWARGMVPHTRQAWATICGVAVTPVTTLGLVLWTVFTHPAITPGALVAFTWWKASGLASAAWTAISKTVLESESLFGVYSFFGSLVHSPSALAAAFLFFSLGTVAAAWVLYRNLLPAQKAEGRYAHASLS
jgi:anti-sigma factor RsiW